MDLHTLLALPLFSGLAPGEIAGLNQHLTTEHQPRGSYLFRSGEPGDALYVVLTGQIALEIETARRAELVSLCGPGDWFGELALLTNGSRSASARATVDATLLRINRAGWAELSLHAPTVFARLCERLGNHLRMANVPRLPARRAVVGCGGEGFEEGMDPPWVLDLARSLRRQFPAREVHVLGRDGSELAGIEATDQPPANRQPGRPDRTALEQALARIVAADALILLAGSDLADRRLSRRDPLEWKLEPGSCGRPADVIRGRSPEEAIDRAARHLAGGTVGVALGAGGAYGFAHLGLQLALDAAGIPVDYVAGTSMGAIMGCGWAAGAPTASTIAVAHKLAANFRRIVLRDVNPRGPSLLRGTGVMRILSEVEELRDKALENLMLPFAAIAMDLSSGEEILLRTGPALDGIRPSWAMPGIFPSCTLDGRTMVDGAMVNPVPVDCVRALGADFVIAISVIPPLAPVAEDPLGRMIGSARRLTDVLPLRRLCFGVEMLEVYLRSFQALWFQLAGASLPRADFALQPDLRRFWYLQFSAAPAIIELGEACAQPAIPTIKATLRERIGLVC